MNIRRILVPTDFSEVSQAALRYGAELAHDYGGQILVLHAVETLGPENVTYGEAVSLQPDGYRKRLWDDLHQIKSPLADVQVEFILSEEDPANAIIRTASERQCDLIVVGSHGRSGFTRFVMGSVAEKVVRKVACPVLVVKPGAIPEPPLPNEEAPKVQ